MGFLSMSIMTIRDIVWESQLKPVVKMATNSSLLYPCPWIHLLIVRLGLAVCLALAIGTIAGVMQHI